MHFHAVFILGKPPALLLSSSVCIPENMNAFLMPSKLKAS